MVIIFFLGKTKRCTNESCLYWSGSILKKKVAEVRKKWKKLTFEMSIWVGKCKFILFFQKVRAGATEGKCFSGHNQKVRKGNFFKVFRITINKPSPWSTNKVKKITFAISGWVKNWYIIFFIQKLRTHAPGEIFFWVKINMHKQKFCNLVEAILKRQVFGVVQKREKLTFKISILARNWQNNFFQKMRGRETGADFFPGTAQACVHISKSQVQKTSLWGTKNNTKLMFEISI